MNPPQTVQIIKTIVQTSNTNNQRSHQAFDAIIKIGVLFVQLGFWILILA